MYRFQNLIKDGNYKKYFLIFENSYVPYLRAMDYVKYFSENKFTIEEI